MPARRTDWDLKLFNANLTPNERKLHLVTVADANGNQRKLWEVSEAPPNNINAQFSMASWAWGAGLERLSSSPSGPGEVLRYADGYGIDTTEPNVIKQGPGATNIGTVSGTMVKILLGPDDRTWFVTTTHLYAWDGTTFENFYGDVGSTHGASGVSTFTDAVVYGDSLVVSYGAGYKHTDGSASPTDETTDVDYMVVINETLWTSYDTTAANIIRAVTDPLGASTTGDDITIGSGEAITNLWKLSGILMVGTESSVFLVNSDETVTELNEELRESAGPQAFSIKAGTGTDIWLADESQQLIRIAALGFDEFDITFPGPFTRGEEERPFTQVDAAGSITGLSKGAGIVYAAVDRGGDLYVYKGVEPLRGRYVWSPLIRRASASNVTIGVTKRTDQDAHSLYVDDGGDIFEYETQDWTKWNADAQIVSPYFAHTDETQIKTWFDLTILAEGDADANTTVQAARRLGTTAGWTDIGAAFGTGIIERNAGILSSQRLQLRFTWTSTDSTQHIDLRSWTMDGIVRPDVKRVWDFTVYVRNSAESEWFYDMREQGAAFTLITDMYGNARSMYILPGYPREQIVFDEILGGPVMAYQIVAQGIAVAEV